MTKHPLLCVALLSLLSVVAALIILHFSPGEQGGQLEGVAITQVSVLEEDGGAIPLSDGLSRRLVALLRRHLPDVHAVQHGGDHAVHVVLPLAREHVQQLLVAAAHRQNAHLDLPVVHADQAAPLAALDRRPHAHAQVAQTLHALLRTHSAFAPLPWGATAGSAPRSTAVPCPSPSGSTWCRCAARPPAGRATPAAPSTVRPCTSYA